MLVPDRHIVIAVPRFKQSIVNQHLNLEACANGRRGGWRLEEQRRHAGRLQNLRVYGICSCKELLCVCLTIPRSAPHLILQIQVRLVTDLERVQVDVMQAIYRCFGGFDDPVEVVGARIGHVEAVGDRRVLGKPIERLEIRWPNDHGVGWNNALGDRRIIFLPCEVIVSRIVYHVILRVAAEPDVRWFAREVSEILHQCDGKIIGLIAAGEGQEVRWLDAKAGIRRVKRSGSICIFNVGGWGQRERLGEGKGR